MCYLYVEMLIFILYIYSIVYSIFFVSLLFSLCLFFFFEIMPRVVSLCVLCALLCAVRGVRALSLCVCVCALLCVCCLCCSVSVWCICIWHHPIICLSNTKIQQLPLYSSYYYITYVLHEYGLYQEGRINHLGPELNTKHCKTCLRRDLSAA